MVFYHVVNVHRLSIDNSAAVNFYGEDHFSGMVWLKTPTGLTIRSLSQVCM